MRPTRFACILGAVIVVAACDKAPTATQAPPATAEPPQQVVPVVPAPDAPVIAATPKVTPPPVPETQNNAESPGGPGTSATLASADAFATEANRILSLPPGLERDATLGTFVRDSMQSGGFERTREWIVKMKKGATRDTANAAFIRDLARVAPGLALDYVRDISDPKMRAELEASIQASVQSGPRPENP